VKHQKLSEHQHKNEFDSGIRTVAGAAACHYLPSPIWKRMFLEAQGYGFKDNTFSKTIEYDKV